MRDDTPPGPPQFAIGELATRTGLSVKLIRHWSDLGIAPPAGRSASGYRRYGPEAVARLELARTLRDLGLGPTEIRGVVDREHGQPAHGVGSARTGSATPRRAPAGTYARCSTTWSGRT